MLPPQRSQGTTLENHMLFIANSTTVTSQTNLSALSTWPAANPPVAIGKPMTFDEAHDSPAKTAKIAACASQKQEADNTSYVGYKA